jgi:hypothetical protein
MDPDRASVASTRELLRLPQESGDRFAEEWMVVRRRIEVVHGVPVSHETEPAGAPRLRAADA